MKILVFLKSLSFKKFVISLKKHFSPASIVLILILIGCMLFMYTQMDLSRPDKGKTVELGLKDIGILTTQVAYYTGVEDPGDSRKIFGIDIIGTSNKTIFTYDGVVEAGINFEQISITEDAENMIVRISLPYPTILNASIDHSSYEVLYEKNNIFNNIDSTDWNDAIVNMESKAIDKALKNGILEKAQINAEALIKTALSGAFGTEYTYEFHWEEPKNG